MVRSHPLNVRAVVVVFHWSKPCFFPISNNNKLQRNINYPGVARLVIFILEKFDSKAHQNTAVSWIIAITQLLYGIDFREGSSFGNYYCLVCLVFSNRFIMFVLKVHCLLTKLNMSIAPINRPKDFLWGWWTRLTWARGLHLANSPNRNRKF